MKTNLIFKRQVTENDQTKVITRIVSVDIPLINAGDGWVLSGHTDELEVMDGCTINTVTNVNTSDFFSDIKTSEDVANKLNAIKASKFQSTVSGTAKLVRIKDKIKIVARRGKKTYNETSFNSVCISDSAKIEFFACCSSFYGRGSDIYEFEAKHIKQYTYWDNFMRTEYERQKSIAEKLEKTN